MTNSTVNVAEVIRSEQTFGYTLRLGNRDFASGIVTKVLCDFVEQILAPGEVIPASGLIPLEGDAAQSLMDSLWKMGIRPKSWVDDRDKRLDDAVQKHLEDMRMLTKALALPPTVVKP